MSDPWPRFHVVSAQAGTKRNLGLGIYEITILLGELKLAAGWVVKSKIKLISVNHSFV